MEVDSGERLFGEMSSLLGGVPVDSETTTKEAIASKESVVHLSFEEEDFVLGDLLLGKQNLDDEGFGGECTLCLPRTGGN